VKYILQVATEADLGLADAYINGYFSFVDKREGLLNLFLVNQSYNLDILVKKLALTDLYSWFVSFWITSMNHFSTDPHCKQGCKQE